VFKLIREVSPQTLLGPKKGDYCQSNGGRYTLYVNDNSPGMCENACLSHLYIKTIILPRQARDTHRESTQKRDRFLTGDNNGTNTQLCTFPNASGCAQGKHTFQKPFYTKHDRFTKTGSGQTWGMHSQKAVVFLAG
jgi:hypothetical protein